MNDISWLHITNNIPRWYNEVNQYNFNNPGFSEGIITLLPEYIHTLEYIRFFLICVLRNWSLYAAGLEGIKSSRLCLGCGLLRRVRTYPFNLV